jgi:peroxiredoxin
LLDREGSREGLKGFGVPENIALPGAVALPLVEIAVAILLLPVDTAWYGALAALVLLLAFVGGIGYNMSIGRTPDCHCFGSLHSEPAGWSTLIRNGVLAAVAIFVVASGPDDAGHSLVGWIGDLSTAEIVLSILSIVALLAIAGEAWLLVHLLGQNGRVLLRLDAMESMLAEGGMAVPAAAAEAAPQAPPAGLPEGSPAPAFRLEGIHGETMTLDALRAAGKPVMLVFSDPSCGPCNALLPDLSKWQREHSPRLTFAVISRGDADKNRAKFADQGLSHVLLQKDREVSDTYKAYGTPTAVIVKPDGTIGSPVAGGAEAIRQLLGRTTGTIPLNAVPPVNQNGGSNGTAPKPAPVRQSKVGSAAPAVSLPDLDGKTVSLADFKGKETVVLFWNPGCGFCRRMVDDLKKWESEKPEGAPALLAVSTGTVEANRDLGLASTVVLDEGFSVGREFGASGTPSAVLVDGSGTIASELMVGAPGVLALLTGEDPATLGGGSAPEPKSVKKGEVAPAVKLKDLDGNPFDLAEQKGSKTMLVFWNPGCGFCRRMVDDVKALEANPPKNAPKIVLVSSGTPESNRELGLASVTLLDEGFNTGRAFGASGTPSAVLIDARGKVASEVAVGAPAVLALAGAPAKANA